MDYESYRADLKRDGVVVVRQFLPPEELAELQDELDRYIRDVVPSLSTDDAFYQDPGNPETLKQLQHMGKEAYFARYRQHPHWNALARTLLGEPAEAMEPEWFNKPPETEHATPPHQDNYYFCLRPCSVLTIWLALDAVDEENGCLRYVAGSHREGIRPHGGTEVLGFSQGIIDYGSSDREREISVPLQPGDAVVHHGETIHRAEANQSANRHRRSFAMVFRGASCQRDEEAYQRYLCALENQHDSMGLKES